MQRITLKKEPRLEAKYEAFPFQQVAVDFAANKEYSAIFYEQGLGKTKIAIDVILQWLIRKEVDTVLVVTKKGLVDNWVEEFEAHSFLKPRVLSSDKSKNYYALNSPSRVMVANFEALVSEKKRMKSFLKLRNVAIIIDESAKLKNPDTKLTQTFFELSSLFKRRIIMTGTPVSNRPQDIWAQIYFLDQGETLGSNYPEFCKNVSLDNKLSKNQKKQDRFENSLIEIFPKIENFCIRETKEGSGLSLPKKKYQNVICEWESHQRELYETIKAQEKYALIRDHHLSIEDAEVTIKRLTRLLQAASNPVLIDENYCDNPGKYDALQNLLEEARLRSEKSIVWTSFVDNAIWLQRKLKRYNPVIIHGELDGNLRRKAISSFKNDEGCEVMVAVPAAAKEGLTLTVANHVIFWDRSLSLDDYLQAQDRIHRISQEKTCYITNLILEDSIDYWVDSLLNAKALAAQLVQSDINLEEYQERADYGFGDLVKDVLGLNGVDYE